MSLRLLDRKVHFCGNAIGKPFQNLSLVKLVAYYAPLRCLLSNPRGIIVQKKSNLLYRPR